MAKESLEARTVKNIIKRIRNNPNITEYNKKLVTRDLVEWLEASGGRDGGGSDIKTIVKWLYGMEHVMKFLPKHTDFNKITKEQMMKAIAELNNSKYSAWTKTTARTVIKAFYRHFYGDDIQIPAVVSFIKTGRPKTQIDGANLLSDAEVLEIVKHCRNLRDKSVIAVMYDLALRSGETKIKMKDVNLEQGFIYINGKTGRRKAWLSSFSIPFLTAYINSVPDKKPDDWLWTDYNGNPLSVNAITLAFKRACKDSGLKKPRFWLYMLRHSRITYWINHGVPMSAIKRQVGHAPGSTITESTYSHLVDSDVREHILAAAGDQAKAEPQPSILKGWTCQYCGKLNDATARFCSTCGRPKDIAIAQQESILEKTALRASIDDEVKEEIINELAKRLKLKAKPEPEGKKA